ncbi:hypothetical protein SU60_01940 [Vibrio mytili]|uniref:PBP domain-containing protein n=1 Tax=Vibrio mytili TaxID=50718 RepID=A0A0C3DM53_9VIBR|nr:hypothetical protein SU60_01940 [Vibrio mytili]
MWGQDLLVIVNKDNPIDQLTKHQVVDLFMGRTPYFPTGGAVMKLDAPSSSDVRREFYQSLVSMSLSEVNAYWARLMFSGRATPPMQVPQEQDIVQLVSGNANAIAYIPKTSIGELSGDIKTIFVLSNH